DNHDVRRLPHARWIHHPLPDHRHFQHQRDDRSPATDPGKSACTICNRPHPVRRIHEIRTVPVLHLAAGCHGGADAGQCISALRHDGQGGNLSCRTFYPMFAFSNLWVWTILIFGLFTMVWASFNAIKKDDLKAVLAFSTVSQLGLIMSLLGLGALSLATGADDELFTVAVVAAVFH